MPSPAISSIAVLSSFLRCAAKPGACTFPTVSPDMIVSVD